MKLLTRLLSRLPRPHWPKKPRTVFASLVELAGLGCLDTAAWWVHPVAGMAGAGAALLLVSRGVE